jgi:hypothetical protein
MSRADFKANGELMAFAGRGYVPPEQGLSKLEYMATHLMAGMYSNPSIHRGDTSIAQDAAHAARALLAALATVPS